VFGTLASVMKSAISCSVFPDVVLETEEDTIGVVASCLATGPDTE
jgi:hypothetical protein